MSARAAAAVVPQRLASEEALRGELLALFRQGVDVPLPEERFDALARAVFAYQFARSAPYRAFCERRGAAPEALTHWSEIPALPTRAFQAADVTTVPPERVRVVYETSGTTTSRAGRCLLPDTELYDAALLPNFRAHVLPDRERLRILVLGPTARHFPRSSLGHMCSRVKREFGAPGSGAFWRASGPCFGCLAAALRKAEAEGEPVALLATALGIVRFLEECEAEDLRFQLPPGSRLMDTGGFKGRRREVPPEELLDLYDDLLGIPPGRVVNEYGMTELGSQFYDAVLRGGPRLKMPPPWVRTQVVDPETLTPLPPGRPGLLRHFDLANLHTALAIQTEDLGVWETEAGASGFRVLGRAAGAEPRGCSLAAEAERPPP